MKRIHIVGCGPRSGTTLICEMMIACFQIDSYGRHEDPVHLWPARPAEIFLTKRPQDILLVESALKLVKDLYVIYMLRDPRDMIVSKHGSDPDRYWSGLRFWKTYTPYGRRLKDHPRFISIRYEDLVERPDEVQDVLMKRMPFLKKRGAFSRYHEVAAPPERSMKALRGVRPVSSASIGNWRRHLPRVAGQLKIHGSISEDLIEYGYERDANWEHELEGVDPDLAESHWPEHRAPGALEDFMRYKNIKAVWMALGHTRPVLLVKQIRRRVLGLDSRDGYPRENRPE